MGHGGHSRHGAWGMGDTAGMGAREAQHTRGQRRNKRGEIQNEMKWIGKKFGFRRCKHDGIDLEFSRLDTAVQFGRERVSQTALAWMGCWL